MQKKIEIKILPLVSRLLIIPIVGVYLSLGQLSLVGSATDSDTVQVSLTIDSTISLNSPADLSLGTIVGSGDTGTGDYVTWNVVTNNAAGYTISWLAEETGVNTAGAMENPAGDTIATYSPAVADTPESWTVASTASEWGGHLGVTGLECTPSGLTANDWGADDTTNAKWLNVHHSAQQEICSSSVETAVGGDDIPVHFRAEVGANKLQPTGTYTVNVTLTATTQ